MKQLRGWLKAAGTFLLTFLIVFPLGFTLFFPKDTLRSWIGSLRVPGEIIVSRVAVDPMMRVKLKGVTWRLEKNPLVAAAVFPRVVVRPDWSHVLFGHRAFRAETALKGTGIAGPIEVKRGHLLVSLATTGPVSLPSPFMPRPGVTLGGAWEMESDIDVNMKGGARGLSGGMLFKGKHLRLKWAASPVGPLDVTFLSGLVKGNISSSVLNMGTIRFRGAMLDVEGNAVIWPDPVSGALHLKGTLYLRPKVGLAASNASLDSVIRMLPKSAQGYKFAF